MKKLVFPVIKYVILVPIEALFHIFMFCITVVISMSFSAAWSESSDIYSSSYRMVHEEGKIRFISFAEYLRKPFML